MKNCIRRKTCEKHVFIHIFMQIFTSFSDGPLKQQICYSFTLLISSMVYNPFKMVVQFFWSASSSPNSDGPNAFFFLQNSTGPSPQLQKGWKIPVHHRVKQRKLCQYDNKRFSR